MNSVPRYGLFMLEAADMFFMIFHSSWVIFNIFGWIPSKTRRLHLITVALTAFSWIVLGFWKGFGYCPFTDFHWKILKQLGRNNLPNSYMKFLVDRTFGTNVDPELTDWTTGVGFLLCASLSLIVNFRKKSRSGSSS